MERLSLLLGVIWLSGAIWSVPVAADAPSDPSGAGRLSAIPVTANLSDADRIGLIALLDQRPQKILDIYLPDEAAAPGRPLRPWQVVVYFDAPLSTSDGLRKAAKALSREAERLTRLGPTEIVIADPMPRMYLDGSRDPAKVREALLDVPDAALSTGELQWHRQRYASAERDEEAAATSRALYDELKILTDHRTELARWSTRIRPPGPRLLILVQNGYDSNPRAFYNEQTGATFLGDPQGNAAQLDLARGIAGEGWMILSLALGPKPREFVDPLAPLHDLARASNGRVIHRHRDLTSTLELAAEWPILWLELDGDFEPGALAFEIQSTETGETLETTRWAALAPNPLMVADPALDPANEPRAALRLLRPSGIALKGEQRLRTVAGHKRIDRVVFSLNGEVVAEATRSPYSAVVDLGPEISPVEVAVTAYSKSGRKLGEDTMSLNVALQPPMVSIDTLDLDPQSGRLTVDATTSAPTGLMPDRVEILLNDVPRATFDAPPFRAEVEVGELRSDDVVRVVAYYPNGDVAEAAEIPGMAGPADVVDVNLVELLAMVTPRNRKSPIELKQADFRIRQQGRSRPVDHFSRWDDLQLTLGLVLDTSDSMQEIIEDAREAGERFLANALSDSDEAFVVDFNNLPRLTRQTTSDADRLLSSLTGLEARGDTALYDAIVFALQQFQTTDGRRALVVVTDGEDSASFYQPAECVRQARLHGVPVYLIVLGTPPDPSQEPSLLRNQMIAQRSGGEVYYISDLDDLSQIYDQIVSELRRQYFLAFNAGHTLSPEELKQIEIEVVPKGVSVRTLLASQQRGG